jgi:hypothetical protein
MISWRMAAAWVVALIVTTVLTWSIVGLADSQVGERLAAVAPPSSTSSLRETSTTTSLSSTTTTVLSPTSSTAVGSTSTSSATGSSAPTSTTSSTTTIAESEWSLQTVNSLGGTVVVRYQPDEVELQAATPAPGFAVEVDDQGPPRVRVEFDGDEVEVRVEVRWENGSLDIDIDEND